MTEHLRRLALCLLCFAALFLSACFEEQPTPQGGEITAGSAFAVHYLDVGQADAALVLCDGHAMLIDGGNVDDADLVTTYLRSLNINKLDYLVCTHAHEDHAGGLAGVLDRLPAAQVVSSHTESDNSYYNDLKKSAAARGLALTVPSAGDVFSLGAAAVQVLGPVASYDDENEMSLVLKVIYGDTSFLFTGDAGWESEHDILAAGFDPAADVLKVGHHGSDSSTSYVFLREVLPDYAVISVGEDNSYGHPHEETLSRLRDADVTVWRTDEQGTIVISSDGARISADFKDMAAVTAEQNEQASYIGNKESQVLHSPDCANLPAERNRIYFLTRQEAIDCGYTPCGCCNP